MPQWLSENRQTSYPFVRPVRLANGVRVDGAILDATIGFSASIGRIGVSQLSNPISASATIELTEIVGRYSVGPVVFSGASVESRVHGDYHYLRWTGFYNNRQVVIALIVDPVEAAKVSWPVTLNPADAEIMPDAITRPFPMVTSISFDGSGGQKLTGNVSLREGRNIQLSDASGAIAIEAGAGLGEGYIPQSEQAVNDRFVRTINGVRPDAGGRFTIHGTDCYYARPELVSQDYVGNGLSLQQAKSRITIGNTCKPCCDCSDYGTIYQQTMAELVSRAKAVSRRYATLRAALMEQLGVYRATVFDLERPFAQIRLTAYQHNVVGVMVWIRNSGRYLMNAGSLTVRFNPSNVRYIENTGLIDTMVERAAYEVTGPTIHVPEIGANSTAMILFHVQFNENEIGPGSTVVAMLEGSLSISVVDDGETRNVPFNISSGADVTLVYPFNKGSSEGTWVNSHDYGSDGGGWTSDAGGGGGGTGGGGGGGGNPPTAAPYVQITSARLYQAYNKHNIEVIGVVGNSASATAPVPPGSGKITIDANGLYLTSEEILNGVSSNVSGTFPNYTFTYPELTAGSTASFKVFVAVKNISTTYGYDVKVEAAGTSDERTRVIGI